MNSWTATNLPQARVSWQLEDVHEAAPKFNSESQELLSAFATLLAKHGEQIEVALQANTSQIIQSIVDTTMPQRGSVNQLQARPSLSPKPNFKEVSVVPIPSRRDDDSILHVPENDIPELTTMEDIAVRPSWMEEGANQDLDRNNSTVDVDHERSELPEYMRGRRTLISKMRSRRSSFHMLRSLSSTVFTTSFQSCVHNMVSSKATEVVVTLAILLNALNIGCEADWTMKNRSSNPPQVIQAANTTFSVFFALELLMRIYAYRMKFFSRSSTEFSWNLFDTFLVISSLVDEALSLLISAPNFTVIRVLRVFRLVRVIRVVRVLRFFQDLRIIVAGIAGAIKSMLWALVLLFLMMYLVSICLMQLTALELDKMDPVSREVALSYYGSLIVSIYTLYQSITGGVDWGDAAQPLLKISPFLALLFSLYISFSVLAVLNIITGVFVENAQNISVADEEQLVIEGFENRVKWFEEVKKLFTTMVGDTGALDAEHFNSFLDEVKVQACFRRLGIDVHQTSKNGLFKLLDFSGTGMVDLEEFALGLQNLHGAAKAIDVARIHCELKKMKKDVQFISGSMRGDDLAAASHAVSLKCSASGSQQPHFLGKHRDAGKSWLSDFG